MPDREIKLHVLMPVHSECVITGTGNFLHTCGGPKVFFLLFLRRLVGSWPYPRAFPVVQCSKQKVPPTFLCMKLIGPRCEVCGQC